MGLETIFIFLNITAIPLQAASQVYCLKYCIHRELSNSGGPTKKYVGKSVTSCRNSAPQHKDLFNFVSTIFTECISARFIPCNCITCRSSSFFFQFINIGRIDVSSGDIPSGKSTFGRNNLIPYLNTSLASFSLDRLHINTHEGN